MTILKIRPQRNILFAACEHTGPDTRRTVMAFGVTLPEAFGRLNSDSQGTYEVPELEQWLGCLGFKLTNDPFDENDQREWVREVENVQLGMGAKPETTLVVGALYFDVDGETQYVYGLGVSGMNVSSR